MLRAWAGLGHTLISGWLGGDIAILVYKVMWKLVVLAIFFLVVSEHVLCSLAFSLHVTGLRAIFGHQR